MKKLTFITTNYEASLWPLCMLAETLYFNFKKIYGIPYAPAMLGEWQNRTNRWAIGEGEHDRVGMAVLARIDQDRPWATAMIAKLIRDKGLLVSETKRLTSGDLSRLSDASLAKRYDAYTAVFQRMYLSAWFPNAVEGRSGLLTKKLESIVQSRGADDISAKEAVSLLISPTGLSGREREEQAFLKMCVNMARTKKDWDIFSCDPVDAATAIESHPAIVQALDRHSAKYGWMSFNYDGPAFGRREIIDRLCLLNASGEKPSDRLLRMDRERRARHSKARTLARQLKLSTSRNAVFLFKLTQRLMQLKDDRKDALFYSYFLMDRVIREIGRRKHFSSIQVKHILPSEMRPFLLGARHISDDALNERIRYSVLYFSKNTMRLYIGNAASDRVKKLTQEQVIDPDTRELRGECAYPGIAKGRARIICSTGDLAKMEQGDVLVSVSTNPNLLPALRMASAIITDRGGITCHAAVIARELRIPCVIGTGIATKILKDGDQVTVNARQGVIERT